MYSDLHKNLWSEYFCPHFTDMETGVQLPANEADKQQAGKLWESGTRAVSNYFAKHVFKIFKYMHMCSQYFYW